MIQNQQNSPINQDDLHYEKRSLKTKFWIIGFLFLLIVSIPIAIGLGPVFIHPTTVTKILFFNVFNGTEVSWSQSDNSIIWMVRTPRVLLAAVVGAALAITGVALQALVRNVLAEPYLLGVSAGASTGAALSLLFGAGAFMGGSALTGSAFIGALSATAMVFALAYSGGRFTSVRLLLAGVAIGYVLNATTSFLIFASDAPEGARNVLFWLLGSLTRATWQSLAIATPLIIIGFIMLFLWARKLDALNLGDDTASALGSKPNIIRAKALCVIALCVGAAVSVSGGIGFVGLIIPHVARLIVGNVHRRLLPVAGLLGASFLIWSDLLARMIFAPRELPLGIVTAIIGAPFLFFLVRRMKS
ncbi:FecCD family ABC transporter permease [Alkalihalobacillus trypoxylicola]|nr:iron ABC transporter permease [Alkalihalobacillus trypoxylicola]